ncbi:hypothetical protein [Amycolatopsis lurida]|uniref:hypothetical protein n=1 Tax=Amycolatopsis lurida TaxID=31959 RepID=UPI000ADE7DED|nr:hypothetical protein [Amycolatopsis lurida]
MSVEGVIGFLGGESFLHGLVDVAVRVGAVSVAEGEIRLADRIGEVAVPQFLVSGGGVR